MHIFPRPCLNLLFLYLKKMTLSLRKLSFHIFKFLCLSRENCLKVPFYIKVLFFINDSFSKKCFFSLKSPSFHCFQSPSVPRPPLRQSKFLRSFNCPVNTMLSLSIEKPYSFVTDPNIYNQLLEVCENWKHF